MYKYIGLMILGLMVGQAQAACDGGTWVTSNTTATRSECSLKNGAVCNGKTFCRSNARKLNWWSAMAWCKKNGMQLASLESLCPETDIGVQCENGWGRWGATWTRTTTSSTTAIMVHPNYLRPQVGSRSTADAGHAENGWLRAMCEEISAANTTE